MALNTQKDPCLCKSLVTQYLLVSYKIKFEIKTLKLYSKFYSVMLVNLGFDNHFNIWQRVKVKPQILPQKILKFCKLIEYVINFIIITT